MGDETTFVNVGAANGTLVFPTETWAPATLDDALAIAEDVELYGYATATEDGHRVPPRLVASPASS